MIFFPTSIKPFRLSNVLHALRDVDLFISLFSLVKEMPPARVAFLLVTFSSSQCRSFGVFRHFSGDSVLCLIFLYLSARNF